MFGERRRRGGGNLWVTDHFRERTHIDSIPREETLRKDTKKNYQVPYIPGSLTHEKCRLSKLVLPPSATTRRKKFFPQGVLFPVAPISPGRFAAHFSTVGVTSIYGSAGIWMDKKKRRQFHASLKINMKHISYIQVSTSSPEASFFICAYAQHLQQGRQCIEWTVSMCT